MKENKYDDVKFFEQYSQMSRSVNGLNGAGEWHELKKMLPDFAGKRVLDLGCGYGWHCAYAVESGADFALGIDLSENMIAVARQRNASAQTEYRCMAIEDFDFPVDSFDVVISSLTFHYLESFGDVCALVRRTLVAGGTFVFSVEHPVFTAEGSEQWICDDRGERLYWPVDNYFMQGRRDANFLGEHVVKFHKTLTTYVNELIAAGFCIRTLVEPMPSAEMMDQPDMRDELRRPMMLLIGCTAM